MPSFLKFSLLPPLLGCFCKASLRYFVFNACAPFDFMLFLLKYPKYINALLILFVLTVCGRRGGDSGSKLFSYPWL